MERKQEKKNDCQNSRRNHAIIKNINETIIRFIELLAQTNIYLE